MHSARTALMLLALFLAVWLPRTLALDRFVTADERRWLTRSANFYLAITHGDSANTFQREHPGVTIMWAGTLGIWQKFPDYPQVAPGQFNWEREDLEDWLRAETDQTPLALLAAGRWWVALWIALAITACYFPLRRLLGAPLAAAATLFIGWDPFFIALSRQLHPDGLVASFTTLAALFFLAWRYGSRQWRYLILSGLVLGLAWLTKTPSIFLVPAGFLLLFTVPWRNAQSATHDAPFTMRNLLLGYVLWGALATIVFVALWPAMWQQPVGTLLRMAGEMEEYIEGHVNPNFFWGQPTFDPGFLFYPVAYLLRTTPAVLIGLLAALFCAWRRTWPFDQITVRRVSGALLLIALLFAVGMTLGSKKFDRYLLPAFPALAVIAACGWMALAHWGIGTLRRGDENGLRTRSLALSILIAFALHALPGLRHYPYYLTYYNPLAGGSAAAERTLMVGWGEGLDEAARWLNQQPDAEEQRVVAWYYDGPVSYFMRSREPLMSFWSPDFWFDADYAVLYLNQWQRIIPSQAVLDYFAGLTPIHVVNFGGLELAKIYDIRGITPPEFTNLYIDSAADFGDQIRLAAYTLEEPTFLSGDSFVVRFYWKRLDTLEDLVVTTQIIAADGSELARNEQRAHEPWSPNGILVDDHTLQIPSSAASGEYQLVVTVAPFTAPQTPLAERAHLVTPLEIQRVRRFTPEVNWGSVGLTELQHEPTMHPGGTLYANLVLTGQVDGSLKMSARLVDPTGATLAQTDKVLEATTRFDLSLPPDAPTGSYQLVTVVYDPLTLNPLPDQNGNTTPVLSQVEVTAE